MSILVFGTDSYIFGTESCIKPIIVYLSTKYNVTFASNTFAKAYDVIHDLKGVCGIECNTEKDSHQLERLVQHHDIIISLMPSPDIDNIYFDRDETISRFNCHKLLFNMCLKYKKHFVTNCRTRDYMKDYTDEIKAKGIIVVNEAGIYPLCINNSSTIVEHSSAIVADLILSNKFNEPGLHPDKLETTDTLVDKVDDTLVDTTNSYQNMEKPITNSSIMVGIVNSYFLSAKNYMNSLLM
jgi:hypothetical protein